ncbi:MAG: hypothetical protein M3279_04075 [Actinomycetota bacterium]|nr:hypothetical protein [Actinomycetota bacterium]
MQRPRGHVLVVVAGVALLATSFVPLWATYRVPGLGIVPPRTFHQNAWTAYGLTMQIGLALALAGTVLALIVALRPSVAPPDGARVLLGVCAAATLLLCWQIVTGPLDTSDPNGYGVDRGILLFTGAALAAAMTYGSHVAWRESGRGGPVRG